jgi:hypothetical protein
MVVSRRPEPHPQKSSFNTNGCLQSKAGFSPDFESIECGKRVSVNFQAQNNLLRHLQHSKHQAAGARARPRMCRREVWVAALNLIEAHSHTLSS